MPAENKQADTVALTPSLPVVISVFCFIINIFKQNGPRSEPTEHISLSGSKWFDPQRVFMKLFFENKKSADDNKSMENTKHAVLNIMYKVSNNIAPEYLTDLFKMRESNSNSTLNLRSVSNKHFLIPKPKINLFKNSLSYSGALVWNNIPLDIKNSMTLNSVVQNCTFWLKGKYVKFA